MAKILIVDDSETLRASVKSVVVATGHTPIEAGNGAEGLDMLKQNGDIRLIFCDVNMPIMNGIAMCKKVHEDPTINHIPIVMLTTEGTPEMKAEAKTYGVKVWVIKPTTPEKLTPIINKLVT